MATMNSISDARDISSSSSTLSQMAQLAYSQQQQPPMPQQPRQPIHLASLNMPSPNGSARNAPQLDANLILSRMVTANGGAGALPIRMASIQDFRRSVDKSMNSHPHQLLRRPVGQTPNQAFSLANRRASDPSDAGVVVGGPKENPMLKLLEERMAAAASQGQPILAKPVQVGPVSSPVRLEDPAATPEQQAALHASISKWAGIDNKVKAQSSHALSTSRSFHKTPLMPSVCEHSALKESFTSCQRLSTKQQEILQQLLLEQQQANDQQTNPSLDSAQQPSPNQCAAPSASGPLHPLSNMMPAPARNGLGRCAVSMAEVDRLRQENQAIQMLQQQAFQERINEQFYLRQRSVAASVLASSSNQSLNTLQDSNDSLKHLGGMGSYRKRGSQTMDDDDEETTCTSGTNTASHTGSRTPSLQSHASFSGKARRTSFGNCTASMENLRINSGNYEKLMNTRNQSFSNGLNTDGSFTVITGAPLNQSFSVGVGTKNHSFHSGLNSAYLHGSSTQINNLNKSPPRKGAFIHSLLSAKSEAKTESPPKVESPKNASPSQSRPPSTGIEHNLIGQHHCSEKIIMSDLPDRIKYQNAQAESKPMDIVIQALESRGLPSNGAKPSFDMPADFFVQSCENYCQEAVDAIRSNDIDALRKLHSNGTNLQCANKFGESLIHLACRRSCCDVVSFLVDEAGVSLCVRDDFGRTPFHDACWRGELDLELIDMLLDREPKLLMLTDKRGHSPLDYTRRGHWSELNPFLLERSEKFQPV